MKKAFGALWGLLLTLMVLQEQVKTKKISSKIRVARQIEDGGEVGGTLFIEDVGDDVELEVIKIDFEDEYELDCCLSENEVCDMAIEKEVEGDGSGNPNEGGEEGDEGSAEGGEEGDEGSAEGGDEGNVEGGDEDNAEGGDEGNAEGGDAGNAKEGDAGNAEGGDEGNAEEGDAGNAEEGDAGNAEEGDEDHIEGGDAVNKDEASDNGENHIAVAKQGKQAQFCIPFEMKDKYMLTLEFSVRVKGYDIPLPSKEDIEEDEQPVLDVVLQPILSENQEENGSEDDSQLERMVFNMEKYALNFQNNLQWKKIRYQLMSDSSLPYAMKPANYSLLFRLRGSEASSQQEKGVMLDNIVISLQKQMRTSVEIEEQIKETQTPEPETTTTTTTTMTTTKTTVNTDVPVAPPPATQQPETENQGVISAGGEIALIVILVVSLIAVGLLIYQNVKTSKKLREYRVSGVGNSMASAGQNYDNPMYHGRSVADRYGSTTTPQ